MKGKQIRCSTHAEERVANARLVMTLKVHMVKVKENYPMEPFAGASWDLFRGFRFYILHPPRNTAV